MGSVKQTLLPTAPPVIIIPPVMDLTDYYAPFKQLVGDYDLTERLKESARLYFNNDSINVNPFGSTFESIVLAAVLVALLSWWIEVKLEKSSDYGLETRSDAEYRPHILKLQRQVSDLEQVAGLQDAIKERGGANSFDYVGYSGIGYSD